MTTTTTRPTTSTLDYVMPATGRMRAVHGTLDGKWTLCDLAIRSHAWTSAGCVALSCLMCREAWETTAGRSRLAGYGR